MSECEQKAEIFRSHYPERHKGGAKTEVHPTISGMMQNYNKKFSELRIRKVCKLAKGFDVENGQLRTCNMFTLKQCRNKLCKMAHFLMTDMEKAYLDQIVKMLRTVVAATVKKPKGVKRG